MPIDSLLNPQLYSNSHIPVIMETETDRQQKNRKDLNRSEEIQDEEMANESTNSSHDSEEVQEEPLVGFYTKKERQQRILKYKQKLQRYRKNKASNQPRNKKNWLHSKIQPRKNGRFASYPDVTEDILKMIKNGSDQPTQDSLQSCDSSTGPQERNLNDIVAEITGIF